MLPKSRRLTRADFAQPGFLAGRRVSSPHLTIVLPKGGKGCAVVVSKKTARLSVTRHRMKRRVLGALRTLPLPEALVVYPKFSIEELSPQELAEELQELLGRIGRVR